MVFHCATQSIHRPLIRSKAQKEGFETKNTTGMYELLLVAWISSGFNFLDRK